MAREIHPHPGASIFGEVEIREGKRDCVDMGNGRLPSQRGARMFHIAFINGTPVNLGYSQVDDGYALELTGHNSFRYGGPGTC